MAIKTGSEIKAGDVAAAVQVIAAVAEAIRGLGEVPSGELYVHVMSRLSIEQYGRVIATLKSAGLIEERNHVLRWIGPK